MMKSLLLCAFLICSASLISANEGDNGKKATTQWFRSGTIYSAEITKIKPEIANETLADKITIEEPVFAEIIVKFPKNRGFSRFDYVLETGSGEYPCLAFTKGSFGYSFDKQTWIMNEKNSDPNEFYRILFAIPSADLGVSTESIDYKLKYKLAETKINPAKVIFRILPEEQAFTPIASLPPEGNYGKTWNDLNPKQEEPPAEEEKPAEEAATEEKPAEEAATEEKPAEEKPAEEKSAEEKPAA
ncbi:MAG: hypothetical protein IKB22_00290 [Lentisphaeria bacterium]|nr:hypothetical protein [Lentisphaeria bacterium]